MTGKELIKQLKKDGWKIERIRGSHHVMRKQSKTVVVPLHNTDIPKGTLNKILKQTGLK